MDIYTIGVYNSNEDTFFRKLIDNKITVFIDIRQRRAVRGSKYTFVNSKKLQEKLSILNIEYVHILDLAPTKEIRLLQKKADLINNQNKKDRTLLAKKFIENYNFLILSKFDLKYFVKKEKFNKIVLFCVEEHSESCHRSLIANKLKNDFNFIIYNL